MGITFCAKIAVPSLALSLVVLMPSVSPACTLIDVSAIERGTRFDQQPTMVVSWAGGGVSTARSGR